MLYSNHRVFHKMSRLQSRCSQIMDIEFFLICMLSISITSALCEPSSNIIEAQGTKGGGLSRVSSLSTSSSFSGIKGAAGFSSFRQNLASVQQRQQQQQQQSQQQQRFEKQEEQVVQQIPIQPIVQQISNTVSSTSTFQKPIVTSQQLTSRVVEEQRENVVQQQSQTDSEPAVYGSVNGVPGIDFPGYTSIPNTPFTCERRPFDPGMYADESTGCQVYHLCYQGRRESFLCGIGTVFNQAIMNCDFWHAVDCSKSSQYYYLNSEFGKASAEGGGNFAKQEVNSQFISNQIQLQPTPILSGKTNFVSKQQFNTNQQQLIIPRPKLAASSSFSRVETSSQTFAPRVSNEKTSIRKEEQLFRNSQNSLSPGRQIKLNQQELFSNNIAQNYIEPNQQSLESSNQFKVVSGNKQLTSVPLAGKSSATIFYNTRKLVLFSGIKGSANEIPEVEDENSAWKPYFKSKPSLNNQTLAPTSVPSSSRPTTDMLTSEVISSTVSLPDKEPTFSGSSSSSSDTNNAETSFNEQPKVPKGSAPYETATVATAKVDRTSDTSSSVGVEPDVSPALTVTTPTPEVSAEMTSTPSNLTMTSPPSDESASVETTTSKASLEEATSTTALNGSEDDNDFGSRSSRSSGSSGASINNSSKHVATQSSVEYENDLSERNKTRTGT